MPESSGLPTSNIGGIASNIRQILMTDSKVGTTVPAHNRLTVE
jgi:hypothetical protein